MQRSTPAVGRARPATHHHLPDAIRRSPDIDMRSREADGLDPEGRSSAPWCMSGSDRKAFRRRMRRYSRAFANPARRG